MSARAPDERKSATPWWGEWTIAEGSCLRWTLGPATVRIARGAGEWLLSRSAQGDVFSDALEIAEPDALADLEGADVFERFADGRAEGERLRLVPLLADRDVISRPETRFTVLPSERAVVYVGSPVWLGIEAVPSGRAITEFPLLRPSDTWFGANTREGELCYASRTRCRMRPEDVRWNPHRCLTRVTIHNRDASPLPVDRINLPVPELSIWHDADGWLRTPAISFVRGGSDPAMAELEVEPGPVDGTQLAPPRISATRRRLRAFSRLI